MTRLLFLIPVTNTMIGRAYKHMLEYRLDNGPVDHDVAVEELKRWYAEIQ